MKYPVLSPEMPPQLTNHAISLDTCYDLGHTSFVVAGQLATIAVVLLLWIGRDLTYTPGWAHPISFYLAIATTLIVLLGLTGWMLRRRATRIG